MSDTEHAKAWPLVAVDPESLTQESAMTNTERHAQIAAARTRAARDLRMARALIGAADQLAQAARALPDVVKTRELQLALPQYRAKREEMTKP